MRVGTWPSGPIIEELGLEVHHNLLGTWPSGRCSAGTTERSRRGSVGERGELLPICFQTEARGWSGGSLVTQRHILVK